MTKQELFDRVATHLKQQRERSVSRGLCVYRGSNGLKCAIGVLIPDEAYHPSLEGLGVLGLEVQRAAGILHTQVDLATELQRVHDEAFDNKFKAGLKAVAAKHGLEWKHG